MNKKGVTILELLISISLISIVMLLLIQVMVSLEKINNDTSYASSDEINRTEIIKDIETEFLNKKLNGLKIDNSTITFSFKDNTLKDLKIDNNKLIYNETYTLKSKNATYDKCIKYLYQELDEDYYLVTISIPVLIDNKNTTAIDDINLSYIGLKDETTFYPPNYTCS